MSYITSGIVQASDYNSFSSTINEVYADLYPGATTLPNAGLGYGQSPIGTVTAGNAILASQWNTLFNSMRNTGTHQGTTAVPPLPASGPISGDTIVSYNTLGNPTAVNTLLTTLKTNRFNIALGQFTLNNGTPYASVSSWTTALTYTTRVNFSSWNNARYFFNSGGTLRVRGASAYVGASPVQTGFKTVLETNMSPLLFGYNFVTQNSGTNVGASPVGFYGLTTSYQEVYKCFLTGGYSTECFVAVDVKLAAAAGTNGLIDFRVRLVDTDTFPETKSAAITFNLDNAPSSGAIVYPGPAVGVTSGGFVYV